MKRVLAWLDRNPIAAALFAVVVAYATYAWAADTAISALSDGGRPDFDDEFVSADSGANNKHDMEDVAGYVTAGHQQRRAIFYTDLWGAVTSTASTGDGLVTIVTGTGASCDTVSNSALLDGHPGIISCDTGTTTTGRGGFTQSSSMYAFGSGAVTFEADVRIEDLSNGTDRYQFITGFFDTNGANQTDGAYVLYDDGGVSTGSAASANWQCVTAEAGTRTFTTSGSAVAADTWYRIRIEVNAGATSVDFFVNGSSICSAHTTNIPDSTDSVSIGTFMQKSLGTNVRTYYNDYIFVETDLTSAR